MTTEQQQNIGTALVKVADIAEKLIPLIRSIGEGLLEVGEPQRLRPKHSPPWNPKWSRHRLRNPPRNTRLRT